MDTENTTVEERKVEKINSGAGIERREQVVEDIGEENRQGVSKVAGLVGLIFGVIEVSIGLRILLELIGANAANPFAQFIYRFTDLFIGAFNGLTGKPAVGSIQLDIPAIIAMLVYALVAWGIIRLIWILFTRTDSRHVSVMERRRE